jgi:hypothetical protein
MASLQNIDVAAKRSNEKSTYPPSPLLQEGLLDLDDD